MKCLGMTIDRVRNEIAVDLGSDRERHTENEVRYRVIHIKGTLHKKTRTGL